MYLTRKVVLSFILPFASSCALNEVFRVCNNNGFKTKLENTLDEYNEHDDTLIGFYLGQINDPNTMIRSFFKRKILSSIFIIKSQ